MGASKSEHNAECTVGVVHIPDGILFFKNRDLGVEYLIDRYTAVHSTPEVHALKGVNLKTKELEGVSIGVNKHKVCVANTHIAASEDTTYDVLCERLLDQTQRKSDVTQIVADFMREYTVQGGRILVSSPVWTYLIEVFKKEYQVQEIKTSIVITNNFSLISHLPERAIIREESSLKRLEVASRMIKSIRNIGMLKSMLRSHIPEKGELSVCNHQQGGGGTESSHIIQIQGSYIGWSSLIGYPCEHDYRTVQLFQG
jgi:hypothetical protein